MRRGWSSLIPTIFRAGARPHVGGPPSSLEFRHVGRILLQSSLVGIAVGAVCCLFYWLLEKAEHLALIDLAGYLPLRPAGEQGFGETLTGPGHLRYFLLPFIPAIGALIAGIVSSVFAPETRGGGGDAYIQVFHQSAGLVRKRVLLTKIVASVFTLGSGGSGGREGPTMQIGSTVGSIVARAMRLTARERRLLVVAGAAGGMAAIFRTPLGAALLAVEVLYRDDFEADALIPAILASVAAYSTFITVFPGTGHLFATSPRYPFDARQLPLYAVMALAVSLGAWLFAHALDGTHRFFDESKLPKWARPAAGGLLLGVMATLWIAFVNPRLHLANHGAGLLGSGYGAAQGAITNDAWIPSGWRGVRILAALALAKMIATSLTIGSGGSGGDFGPSVAMGGLLGGAFGRAAQLLVDPSIDPGAFALVGMGTFYGGLAHAPVSSAVMICEMAGSYDLLVPLMLSEGIAFVALRKTSLYPSQRASRFDSPAHADDSTLDVLKIMRVADTVFRDRAHATVRPTDRVEDIVKTMLGASPWQDVFPVMGAEGALVGLVSADAMRTLVGESELARIAIAADIMDPPVTIATDDDLHAALEKLLDAGLRELPVIDADGKIVGLLDESDVARAYHRDIARRHEARGT